MPIYFKLSIQELPLTIDSIGHRWYQESVHRINGFPLYHWLQTETGQGIVDIKGQKIILNPGEGLLISPHIAHHYQKTSDSWHTSFVTFGGKLSNDIHKICGNAPYLFINAQDGLYFQNWIDNTIVRHLEGSLDDFSLSSQCFDFLIHLSGNYTDHTFQENPLYDQYVAPVIKKIETDYNDSLDVDELAFYVHVSPQYLTRLFQRFTGYSVRSYITRFRINKAKELLVSQSYLSIQHISCLCGYNDVSYFISVFRQQTGTTPKQFRKIYGVNGTRS